MLLAQRSAHRRFPGAVHGRQLVENAPRDRQSQLEEVASRFGDDLARDDEFDPANLDVSLNGVPVCVNSGPGEPPEKVSLEERAVDVLIDLKAGAATATIWTNDLTHAYVHENSAYST